MQSHHSSRAVISGYTRDASVVGTPPIGPEPLAMSPSQAAARLGIGRTFIYELINDGSLKSIKIGSRRLITLDAIRALLASREAAVEANLEASSASAKRRENSTKHGVSR